MRMDSDIMHKMLLVNPETEVVTDVIGFFRWHSSSKCTVSVDTYNKEHEKFIKEMNINPAMLKLRQYLFKAYRFLTGGYMRSWYATNQFRNTRMSDIWAKHNLNKEQ